MNTFPGRIMIAAALLCWAPAAQAEVVETKDDLFVTRATAEVSADPKDTWLALVTPSKWWNGAHSWSGDAANMTLTPQGGGCFCERLPVEDNEGRPGLAGSVKHMTVLLAMPEQVLRMRGGLGPLQSEPVDGVLTVTLKPVDGGTRILWEYVVGGAMRYDVPTISKAVDGVMSEQLARLVAHLGPATPPGTPAEEAPEMVEEAPQDDAPSSPSVEEAFGDMQGR